MPWKEPNVEEERLRFIVAARQAGANRAALCRQFGISRSTGYLWLWRREEVEWLSEVEEKSRRPHRSPYKTPAELEEEAIRLRKEYGFGAKKLHVLLERRGISLPVITLNRIIKRNGLVKEETSQKTSGIRYEKSEPNEMLQMDFKGFFVLKEGKCYPLMIIDDCSRYALAVKGLTSPDGESVYRCLLDVFEENGMPESMLMDHGIPWWSTTNAQGLTWLVVALIKQGIKLHYSRIRHPQTQGKVERLNRTLVEYLKHRGMPETLVEMENMLREFREMYNNIRPHEALGMDVPASKYRPSQKQYDPNPKAWEYPAGAVVVRLNTQGCMNYKGRRYFVCEALAKEWVRVDEVDGCLVVSYRHMFIREIDAKTASGRPFLWPMGEPA